MTMIDRAINERRADAHRVYITGYSQGSNGTWTMLSRYEGRFAAAIPISGGNAAADFVGARLIDTPILRCIARRRFDIGDGHTEQHQQHPRRRTRAAADVFTWQQRVDVPSFQSKYRNPSSLS